MVKRVLSGLPDGVQLRPIQSDDMEFLYQLYASTRAEELAQVDWNDEQKAEFLTMQFNAQHQYYQEHYQQASFDIIVQNNIAIGRLYLDRRREEYRIIDIALMPTSRRQGLGAALMQAIIDEASSAEKKVSIHVERNNPALNLYYRLGFVARSDEGVYIYMERPVE